MGMHHTAISMRNIRFYTCEIGGREGVRRSKDDLGPSIWFVYLASFAFIVLR